MEFRNKGPSKATEAMNSMHTAQAFLFSEITPLENYLPIAVLLMLISGTESDLADHR